MGFALPSVQIPGPRCKLDHAAIVQLAVVRWANGQSASSCSQNKNALL